MIKFNNNPVRHIVSVSSEFGFRFHPIDEIYKHHPGNDLRPKVTSVDGDGIYSVADGKVVVSKVNGGGVNSGYGYYVIIDHDGWCSLYGHLMALDVEVGQTVAAGEQIGRMGNTGLSSGTHLHFGIYDTEYTSEIFTRNIEGEYKYSADPLPYYIDDWKNIIMLSSVNQKENWIATCQAVMNMAAADGDSGDMELAKYLDSFLIKITDN